LLINQFLQLIDPGLIVVSPDWSLAGSALETIELLVELHDFGAHAGHGGAWLWVFLFEIPERSKWRSIHLLITK
jgi:hypothetical protein